jgi:hypothetical protein
MKIGGIPGTNRRMVSRLMTAKIRVHEIALGEILRQPVAEFGEGLSADLQRPVEEIEGQS